MSYRPIQTREVRCEEIEERARLGRGGTSHTDATHLPGNGAYVHCTTGGDGPPTSHPVIAAGGLAVLMAGAAQTRLCREESPAPPIVLPILATVIAVGRFGLI